MRPDKWHKTQKLVVRTRRIFEGGGAVRVQRSVACPRRATTVALSECEACDAGEEIQLRNGDGWVGCRAPVPAATSVLPTAARRLLPAAAERTPVSELMTTDVTCVARDVDIEAFTALCLDRGFGAAPVVDEDGFPVGVVSKTDLVRERFESAGDEAVTAHEPGLDAPAYVAPLPRATVADVMTPVAYTLHERDPLSRAAAMMAVEGVHHLPIVGDDGRVVGMLSAFDFARFIARAAAVLPDEAQ